MPVEYMTIKDRSYSFFGGKEKAIIKVRDLEIDQRHVRQSSIARIQFGQSECGISFEGYALQQSGLVSSLPTTIYILQLCQTMMINGE